MTKIIDLKDVSFSYSEEGPKALDNVSLQVNRGEHLAILGHNGSGKSTLAKMLNAILVPDEGKVLVDGLDTSDEANLWDIRARCGMVFQSPDNQLVATVVEEEVAFGPENLGLPSQEIRKRVDGALEMVGMVGFERRNPSLLSGGQKQRIAIAGVLAMEPSCIVMDEPTAMLDPYGKAEILETALRLNEDKGITIINITHFMNEATLADRVVVMDSGKIVLEGSPREVFKEVELLESLHLGVPQVTKLSKMLYDAGLTKEPGALNVLELVEEI